MKIGPFRIRNFAALDEPDAPELCNVTFPVPPSEVLAHIEKIAKEHSLWRVESKDNAANTIHLTHRTRYLGFVDDVHLTVEEIEGGARVRGTSKGRLGVYDFGGNRRNLRELIRALRQEIPSGSS